MSLASQYCRNLLASLFVIVSIAPALSGSDSAPRNQSASAVSKCFNGWRNSIRWVGNNSKKLLCLGLLASAGKNPAAALEFPITSQSTVGPVSLAARSDGNIWAAWNSINGTYLRIMRENGSFVTDPIQVSQDVNYWPAVASFHDDAAMIAWVNNNFNHSIQSSNVGGMPYNISGRVYNSNGSPSGPAFHLAALPYYCGGGYPDGYGYPAVKLINTFDDNVFVAYLNNTSSQTQLLGKKIDRAGDAVSRVVELGAVGTQSCSSVYPFSIGQSQNGNLLMSDALIATNLYGSGLTHKHP